MSKTMTSRGATECFTLAKEWLEDCIESHANCASPSGRLPKRVIKVGSNSEEPKLYITGNERAHFVALSHCWGGSQVLTTTTGTLTEREQGIMMCSLPQTFQDSVIITRQLGIQYLWIDSLCILQDSAEDWAQESAKMAAIYSDATVVIAADAASKSAEGCFGQYPQGPGPMVSHALSCQNDDGLDCQVYVRICPGKVRYGVDHIADGDGTFYNLIPPLHRRAWALQERLLSSRILHYGYSELAWECWTHTICECTALPEALEDDRHMQFRSHLLHSAYNNRNGWFALVAQYTSLALTVASDRLAALSGMAAKHQISSSEYICGLWRDDLVRGLLWESHHPSAKYMGDYWTNEQHARHEQYIAPSWSWASIHGYIHYDPKALSQCDIEVVEILGVDYTLASSNIYGALTSGSITMRGSPLPILLEPDLSIHLDMRKYSNGHEAHNDRFPIHGKVALDVDIGPMALQEVLVNKPLFLLISMTSSQWFAPFGIKLRAKEDVPGDIPTFERVGYWSGYDVGNRDGAVAEIAMETMEQRILKII